MGGKKLPFVPDQCDCGFDLSGQKVEVAGLKGDIPMGYCPECHKAYPLKKPEPKEITE